MIGLNDGVRVGRMYWTALTYKDNKDTSGFSLRPTVMKGFKKDSDDEGENFVTLACSARLTVSRTILT